jgi:hypothetical protein
MVDVTAKCLDELGGVPEDAVAKLFVSDEVAELSLNLRRPRTAGGSAVHAKARVLPMPCPEHRIM